MNMISVILIDCIHCSKSSVEIADPRYDNHNKIVRTWDEIPEEDRPGGEIYSENLCFDCLDVCEELMTKFERHLSALREFGVGANG